VVQAVALLLVNGMVVAVVLVGILQVQKQRWLELLMQ
jgi:tetrahydromethanopterin S-methyltransferase subunit F